MSSLADVGDVLYRRVGDRTYPFIAIVEGRGGHPHTEGIDNRAPSSAWLLGELKPALLPTVY